MNNQQQQGMQINPQEVAAAALMFLARANFQKHERATFDAVDAMLGAIAQGTLVLANPPQQEATPATPIETARRRRSNGIEKTASPVASAPASE